MKWARQSGGAARRFFSPGASRHVAVVLPGGTEVPIRMPDTWEREFFQLRFASLDRGPAVESAGPGHEHLECPTCGARYLARGPCSDELQRKDRWFQCHRCNKRVRSAEPEAPASSAAM
jgi:hypothetical protein